MKYLKYIGLFILLLIVVYLLGPKEKFESVKSSIPQMDLQLEEVQPFLQSKLDKIVDLKPNNTFELDFYDGVKKTEYVLLYLHGFSASPKEGFPLHQEIAERYGMNFFAPLLAGHGRASKESFKDLQPADLINDAREAIAIAKILGEKIVLMSCSTGSTLSIFLEAENPGIFHSQLMFSPNIDLADPNSKMLTKPWGLSLAKLIGGSDYYSFKMLPESKPYWTTEYRVEGLVALRDLLDQTMMSETWKKIKAPFLIGYYYEDEENKDNVISVSAIKEYEKHVSTSKDKRWVVPFTDPKGHVIICGLQATTDLSGVRDKTFEYLESVLNLRPVEKEELELVPAN